MSTLLFLHAWSAASRRDRASYWALSAIAVSAVAAAVQYFRVTLHQHFNHNDLYHLIQIAGMALFFRGGKLLRDRSGPHGNMKSNHVLCLSSKSFHRMHYVEWGDPDAERVVICVHGLTRNCRDFDYLAQALLPEFRVVCPDVAGRGQSDWLPAKDDYGYPQYCADMTALIARVTAGGRPRRIYWVGTSMGGIFGMLLASRPKSPLEKLVLNDVGTFIPGAALERIGTYVGKDPRFKTLEEMETMVRFVSAPFGPLTDAQWRHLTVSGAKQHADGSWGFCYDPGIGIPFQKKPLADVDLWQFWDAIACPTLLLRGAQSDLLPKDAAIAMTRRGPRPRLIEFEGVGHAPMLMADDQIKVVREFLLEG
jgi:pimeloyl-ACP methyl ester carboxylesterase